MKPCRNQLQMRSVDLDSLLAADHPARSAWAFVEGLDLSPLYAQIEAAGERPGRPAIDPRILMAPWLAATVFIPIPDPKNSKKDPHQPRPGDTPAIAAWRLRMNTEQAKVIYKQRAATAECVNAQARNRGPRQFFVRGVEKVRAALPWFALAHNLMRSVRPLAQPVVA